MPCAQIIFETMEGRVFKTGLHKVNYSYSIIPLEPQLFAKA